MTPLLVLAVCALVALVFVLRWWLRRKWTTITFQSDIFPGEFYPGMRIQLNPGGDEVIVRRVDEWNGVLTVSPCWFRKARQAVAL